MLLMYSKRVIQPTQNLPNAFMSNFSIQTPQDLHRALLHGVILPIQTEYYDVPTFKRKPDPLYMYITDDPNNSKALNLVLLNVYGEEIVKYTIQVTNTSIITDTEAIDQVFQRAIKEHNFRDSILSVFIFGKRILGLVQDLELPVIDGSSEQEVLQCCFQCGERMTDADYMPIFNKHINFSYDLEVMCFTEQALMNIPCILTLPEDIFSTLKKEGYIDDLVEKYVEEYGVDTEGKTQPVFAFASMIKNDISISIFNQGGKLVKEYVKFSPTQSVFDFQTLYKEFIAEYDRRSSIQLLVLLDDLFVEAVMDKCLTHTLRDLDDFALANWKQEEKRFYTDTINYQKMLGGNLTFSRQNWRSIFSVLAIE